MFRVFSVMGRLDRGVVRLGLTAAEYSPPTNFKVAGAPFKDD